MTQYQCLSCEKTFVADKVTLCPRCNSDMVARADFSKITQNAAESLVKLFIECGGNQKWEIKTNDGRTYLVTIEHN